MVGLCLHCDKYSFFHEYNNLFHCSNCSNTIPSDYKSNFFNLSLQIEIGKQQINIEPLLISKTFETLNSYSDLLQTIKDKEILNIFKNEINHVKELSRKERYPIPVVLDIFTKDRKLEIAVGIYIHPEGRITYPTLKPQNKVGNKINYFEYLKSPEWKSRRIPILQKALYRCQICYSTERLEVHHRTYNRIGTELDSDLTVLCHNCHDLFSKQGRLEKN